VQRSWTHNHELPKPKGNYLSQIGSRERAWNWGEKEEDVEGDLEEIQKEVEDEVDEGEILALRRVLSGQKGA